MFFRDCADGWRVFDDNDATASVIVSRRCGPILGAELRDDVSRFFFRLPTEVGFACHMLYRDAISAREMPLQSFAIAIPPTLMSEVAFLKATVTPNPHF
jgi:hypothetical protein